MKKLFRVKKLFSILLFSIPGVIPGSGSPAAGFKAPGPASTFLGFDRNVYPGDEAIPLLRRSFAFTGYWLSPPPGEKVNSWIGKREFLHSQGFGFLLLFRGRLSGEFKNLAEAEQNGKRDAAEGVRAALAEGFPPRAVLFLDIEQGGRLPDLYHAYLRAWFSELARGGFAAGVYCSGIPVQDGPGRVLTTADDIQSRHSGPAISYWVYNDVCPTSIGCAYPRLPASPAGSGSSYASVWQYAQSPRRGEFTRQCAATYQPDGNCYAPADLAHRWFLDLNSAFSDDPSRGRQPN